LIFIKKIDHIHNIFNQNCTTEVKPNINNLSKSPPQIKTEPKESKIKISNEDSNKKAEIINQNILLKKLNDIKFNKFIMNKSINMSQNLSPKMLAQNSLQKSSNLVNQSNETSANNQSILNNFNKFNKTFLNVGMIKNRKKEKNHETIKNINIFGKDPKFINLKKGNYNEFNPGKSLIEKPKTGISSQTHENISINTSHNVSLNLNSNQMHLIKENKGCVKGENLNEYSILEKKIENLLENNDENKEKNIENICNIFEFLKIRHKNYENLLMKGQLFLTRICEDYLNKCEKEQVFKEMIEKLSYENEKLQKDSHEIENNLKKNKKDVLKNENLLNSSSTNYTNTSKFL